MVHAVKSVQIVLLCESDDNRVQKRLEFKENKTFFQKKVYDEQHTTTMREPYEKDHHFH